MAEIIKDRFPGASVHLPYAGLYPGREESFTAKKDLMLKAVEIAELYNPDHLIGHPGFRGISDSVLGRKKFPGFKRTDLEGLSQTPALWWLEQTTELWGAVLENTGAKLYLENTQEHSPYPILHLLEKLSPKASFCLDFGHWFHYAMGRHWDNLDHWLTLSASKLSHVHVHDNNGESDQHRALGDGLMDYQKISALLGKHSLKPTMTLENHFAEDLKKSYAYLTQNPLWSAKNERQDCNQHLSHGPVAGISGPNDMKTREFIPAEDTAEEISPPTKAMAGG
jgi:sugar phosphate isomerase/epimerase